MAREIRTSFKETDLLTIPELMRELDVGKDQAYALAHDDSFPSLMLGGQFKIPYFGLMKWIAEQAGAEYSPLAAEEKRR